MAMVDWQQQYGDRFRGCRALVTGGAGFIGSHLTEALVHLGADVVVLDDLSGADENNLDDARAASTLEFVKGSIIDVPTVARCIEGCRFVFHLGALPSVPRSVEQPGLFQLVNVTGTHNLLEASRQAGVQRIMFAASSSAYGDVPTLPKIESMEPQPKSPYAANKLAGEHMMRAYASSYEIDTVSLRYFNIFGPRQNTNSTYAGVIAAFAKAMINDQQPLIYGDGEQSRDFTYVANAVHANLLAAQSEKPIHGSVLNIGCGVRVTINNLARQMAEALDKPHLTPRYQPARTGDVLHSMASLDRSGQTINYAPIVDFPAGLQATLKWYETARPWTK